MSDFLSKMLLGQLPTEVPKGKGRTISFAANDTDIRLTTGTMRERVLCFLYLNGIPSMARDIAAGIKSSPSRVTKTLKELIERGEAEAIKHDGCVLEYSITLLGLKNFETSSIFAELKR